MTTITPRALNDRIQHGEKIRLLDVRTPAEYGEFHVPGVHLAPLGNLDTTKLVHVDGFAKDQDIFILCHSGGRATLAAAKLEKSGYTQCHVVEGGTLAWVEAGLPVERGTIKVISLERQVRIAAGGLVLTGVLLAQFVHPAFIWLSGFVGAGLIFAGLTDWCGMGILIARMPWNQRAGSACCAK